MKGAVGDRRDARASGSRRRGDGSSGQDNLNFAAVGVHAPAIRTLLMPALGREACRLTYVWVA